MRAHLLRDTYRGGVCRFGSVWSLVSHKTPTMKAVFSSVVCIKGALWRAPWQRALPRGTGGRNPALSSSALPKLCVSYPRPPPPLSPSTALLSFGNAHWKRWSSGSSAARAGPRPPWDSLVVLTLGWAVSAPRSAQPQGQGRGFQGLNHLFNLQEGPSQQLSLLIRQNKQSPLRR